jgi:hypothetical protein
MTGDKYQVFYSTGGGTILHGTYDTWPAAREARNELFNSRTNIRACWMMRTNPSLGLQPDKYGTTLRRTKHEATR